MNQRLTVLVAASDPSTREAIGQALGTRNYKVAVAPLDRALGAALMQDGEPCRLAIIAPDEGEEALAACRGLREEAVRAGVRVVLCAEDALRPSLDELGDHFVPVRGRAEAGIDRDALLGAIDLATRHLRTILVADDEPLIRRMFTMYFTNEGYNVVAAEDGEEALSRVQETRPDLVVTDIQMPRVDGYEVCRSIKESRDTQHIPVIIVSALGDTLDIDKGFHAGANEYVTKPVDLNELSSRIQNIFRGIELRGRERVLVVTDSPIERSFIEYGLSQQGFEVTVVGGMDTAFEAVLRSAPGVMVCDLEPPGSDLVGLRRQLAERPELSEIPLVVLSSAATKLDRQLRAELKAAAFINKPFPIERLVVSIERILGERRSNLEIEREILLQTIRSLVTTLEARDSYTRGHSENVSRYTKMIARRVYSSEEEIKRVELSAQLHDIGKIGVPDAILLKPGRLTDEEMRIMQTHPGLGAEILKPIQSLQDVVPGVRWHHERIDGRGYPDGLAGEDIPLMARIIAVADTFDALTSSRPYRRGGTVENAMQIIRDVAGTQLDAELVRVFDAVVSDNAFSLRTRGAEPVSAT